MQQYFRYITFLLLLQKCLGHDYVEEETVKKTKNAIEELLRKMNEVSMQSFSIAPYSAKLEMFRKVEAKLKKAAKSLGAKGERYVKLIMRGIKARALNEMSNNNKTQVEIPSLVASISKINESDNVSNNSHKTQISTEIYGGTEINDNLITASENLDLNEKDEIKIEDIHQNFDVEVHEYLRRVNSESDFIAAETENNRNDENYSHVNSVPSETSTGFLVQTFTPHYECQGSLEKICLNIKQMKELKCHFDDSVVPIEKLCDGFTDCIDRTDEKFCTSQVTERIQNANQVIHLVDESFQLNCFPNKTKNSVMTTQIIVLRSVLQAQQEFVQKYKYFNVTLINKEGNVKRAVNEISLIISTLALALDADLCSQRTKIGEEFLARKFNDLLVEDFDKVMEEVEFPPKSCACKEERCENVTACTETCKRICWQKHSLTRWSCSSINETENVPLGVICDGKFDCFDQSDEKGCVTGKTFAKFEANKIFKEILSSLSTKAKSREYGFIRNMVLSLRRTIEDLQRFCMASEPDLKIIRALRKKCFSALSSIYAETVTKASFLYQKSELYVFLTTLNENIVNALKRSNTGNKRIISNERCFCTNGRCSMPVCSRNCLRSCIAEPWLTRYLCENSSNTSVSLDDVCNGKPNCPNEEDEAHCEKEICRRHHLTLLRHNIQKFGKKQEGTAMGELLAKWKTKVSSTLLIAESNYRPSPRNIRYTISDILNDLVITYGAVKDYRRDNEYALQEFISIARYIMTFLKSCGS